MFPFVDARIDGQTAFDDELVAAVRAAAAQHRPFSITLDHFGTFGGGGKKSVVWLGVDPKGEDDAYLCQSSLCLIHI